MEVQSKDKPEVGGPSVDSAPTQPPIEDKGQILEVSAAYTAEEERRVLRKIDCTILPMVSQPKRQPQNVSVLRY